MSQHHIMTLYKSLRTLDTNTQNNCIQTKSWVFISRFFTPIGRLKALQIVTPGQGALNHSLNHLSLCNKSRHSAKSITRKHVCPDRYPFTPGWREAIIGKNLLKNTSVTTGIRTHTLLNRDSRAWIWCSYPLRPQHPTWYRAMESCW